MMRLIVKFLKKSDITGVGKRIYAVQATWALFGFEATVFAAICMPYVGASSLQELPENASKVAKKSLESSIAVGPQDQPCPLEGIQAELFLQIKLWTIKIGNLKILQISGAKSDKEPMEAVLRVGSKTGDELYFRVSAKIVLFPGSFEFVAEVFLEFKKGTGKNGKVKQPRLRMDVRFVFFDAVELKGSLRLTMARLAPNMVTASEKYSAQSLPGGKAASGMAQLANMMMFPRKIKVDLALQSTVVSMNGERYNVLKEFCLRVDGVLSHFF